MVDKETFIILIPGFAKDENDTTCLPFQQVFAYHVKRLYPNLHIIIFTFQYPYQSGNYNFHSIPVVSFGGGNKGGLQKILLRLRIYAKLKEINPTYTIKGILSFWCGECAMLGSKFGRRYGIKHYCWLMGQDARKGNVFINKIKPLTNELIALSDFLQDEFERNYIIRPYKVITPGIDINNNSYTNTKKDIDLLAVGSLISLKQFEIFIEVVTTIKKTIPSIKAVLIGDGPEKEALTTLIKNESLQSNIILTGEISHPEVKKYMARTKVFLHPSSYEGFGIVCLEALYGGADVISFVKPMKMNIPNWTIVNSKDAMVEKGIQILQEKKRNQQIHPFLIENTVHQIMNLFTN